MNINTFSVKRLYEIKCKLFKPEMSTINRVIIGVHGFAGDKESSMLEKLAAELCPCGVALLCFDFPAHGSSPVAEDMLTVENCKQDLCRVYEYAREEFPTADIGFFATSFGGYITLQCAHAFPGCDLILRAPAVTMPVLLLDNVLCTTLDRFREVGVIQCGFERPIRLPYSFVEELQTQENLNKKPIQQRILIIHGDRDDIVPIEDIREFIACHNTATLQVIVGADHRFKKPGEMEEILSHTKAFLSV